MEHKANTVNRGLSLWLFQRSLGSEKNTHAQCRRERVGKQGLLGRRQRQSSYPPRQLPIANDGEYRGASVSIDGDRWRDGLWGC